MEFNIRAVTEAERMYFYHNSQQIFMQTGHIGYLRADMDSDGKGFFSNWEDFRASLKSDEFKKELDEVINACRFDDKYGRLLGTRDLMKQYCNFHKEAEFNGNYTKEYGFRVDTDKYTYLMRVNPTKGDYNLYCYCYAREWLDNHIRNSEKGIRFITPYYKVLFKIDDGDKIRIKMKDGTVSDHTCRYVDDYHLYVGTTLYHVCEFSERMSSFGNEVMPLRSSLPEKCYSVFPSNGKLILITKCENECFEASNPYDSPERNREIADERNKEMGVSNAQEAAMLSGVIYGWQSELANPKNYDENGISCISKSRSDRGEAR